MNKKGIAPIYIILIIVVLLAVGGGVYYYKTQKDIKKQDDKRKIEDHPTIQDNYLGSYYDGNYVYGGAMNLAWNDLSENIVKEKVKLNTSDAVALEMADKFNNAVFTKNDLDEKSYYIKSGYGQATVDRINKESRAKFPDKSFSDLDLELGNRDIISYAYFLKKVEYPVEFKEGETSFNQEIVKGFYAGSTEQGDNVEVVEYKNDDNFIVKLKLKDNSDEIFLAKGFDMEKPAAVVREINQKNKDNLETIGVNDLFSMPKLHLDYQRDYAELMGKCLSNEGFQDYCISIMKEKIKFDMDQKGARVENEAVIVVSTAMPGGPSPEIKKFILDKPFWIVMKRSSSINPYFILGVNNTALMEK